MIPGMESSFSGVGHLRDEINCKLRYKADSHEISNLESKINNLNSTIEYLRSDIGGLQSQLQELQSEILILKEKDVE